MKFFFAPESAAGPIGYYAGFVDLRRPERVGLTAALLASTAAKLRAALPCPPARVAAAMGKAFQFWHDKEFPARRETVSRIAESFGYSVALLDESLDALLAPFSRGALESLAERLSVRHDLIGFVMPGNVPGAGLHEICTTLMAGAALIVKTASAEPFLFARLMETIAEIDAQVAERVAVLSWSRKRTDLTDILKTACDLLIAFGEDSTLARLSDGVNPRLLAFGTRVSGELVGREAMVSPGADEIAGAVARDLSLFEQQGCLSPHHIFVEDSGNGEARHFAQRLVEALERRAERIPPPARIPIEAATAIRRARESARWRRLGGEEVELWEGGGFGWTVIYDAGAGFRLSPGYRTAYVTPISDLADFRDKLAPAGGRLEAFALAAPERRAEPIRTFLSALGVSYLCAPGEIQSPPLQWRHGGGALLDIFMPEGARG
jgi:hypothetical protein